MGVVLAGIMFFGLVSLATVAIVVLTSDDSEEPAATAAGSETPTHAAAGASEQSREPAEVEGGAAQTEGDPAAAATTRAAKSLKEIAWTTDAPSTPEELSRAWSIPGEVLATLNPDLPAQQQIEAGTEVIVHSYALGAGFSVGPPNDGRLTRGVPLPEGEAWALPADRTRAFATAETIAALIASLEAYGQQFPEAEPVQIGDLSARRGGEISGHQSHQSGRDVDIRLIEGSASDVFDPERNWFLVKTLIDGSDVRTIFLNGSEQSWLRSAAEADVGAASAEQYFAFIRHERGHTIHMHVRFACPKEHKRCVAYTVGDTEGEEQAPKKVSKLPPRPGSKPNRGKLPGRRPKSGGKASGKKKTLKPKKKKKKGKKKGKKKKGR